MHRVVDDNPQCHGDDDRHSERDIADHIAPEPEAHDRRHKVRHQRDEAELEVAQNKEDDKGDEDQRKARSLQHRGHVTGRDHCVDMRLAGDRALQFRRVFIEPALDFLVERNQLARRRIVDEGRDTGRGPVDIDLVCQVHAVAERQFVEKQELRGFLVAVGDAVIGRIVAVHVHVQPLDRIAERADMADLGLVAKEDRQRVECLQIFDRVDAVLDTRIDRIFQHVQTAKLGLVEIGGLPCLEALVEIAQEIILELDLRDAGAKGDDHHRDADKKALLVTDHELAERDHEIVDRGGALVLFDRQPADQARKQEHGEDPHADHAAGDHVAELAEGWRDREVQRQEADGRGENRDRDAESVINDGAARPDRAVGGFLHCLADRRQHMHAAGDGKRDDHQRRHGGGRVDRNAGPAQRAQRDERRQRGKDKDQQRAGGRAKQHTDNEEHRHKHRRSQRLAVLLAGGGECLADRDRAAGLELDVRIGGAVFFEKRLEFGIDVRNFRDEVDPGKPEDHRNRGGAGILVDQAVADLDAVECHRPRRRGFLVGHHIGFGNQILDDHHVAVGIGVLEAGDGIHQPHIGKVPQILGHGADGTKGARGEHLAIRRNNDDGQIVVLGEFLFKPVEADFVRVVGGHEDTAVRIELQVGNSGEHTESKKHGDDRHLDTVVHNEFGKTFHKSLSGWDAPRRDALRCDALRSDGQAGHKIYRPVFMSIIKYRSVFIKSPGEVPEEPARWNQAVIPSMASATIRLRFSFGSPISTTFLAMMVWPATSLTAALRSIPGRSCPAASAAFNRSSNISRIPCTA